jgi:hypothetical protein
VEREVKRFPPDTEVDIPDEKLLEYILSEAHPVGKWKARFFGSFGIDQKNSDVLRSQLVHILLNNDIVQEFENPYGIKYVVDGIAHVPSGAALELRTVWARDKGSTTVRFVTTYPR